MQIKGVKGGVATWEIHQAKGLHPGALPIKGTGPILDKN